MWMREVAQDWYEEYIIGYKRLRPFEVWYGDPARRPEGYAQLVLQSLADGAAAKDEKAPSASGSKPTLA